ncbi:Regulator of RNase E activity RraA [Algoriphagus locisalis]|uniref:Regulator of RNase E activity RraA n=1 Tax=Algoriphagus locisalis TaxID=305507 RepID=A0A1I7E2A3_9BACT|nr:dimethylmenaquinone methyltransferase [Algoriphagus locisalis]SFU18036.1 Regulator of RNase E activity RraA [Algoriphagus locisalis]
MNKTYITLLLLFFFGIDSFAQQISKEEMLFLTQEWKGERFEDGRPKVSDDLLRRMKIVTHDEAWAVMKNAGYKYQYAEGWEMINPDSIMVGRALTATFMPGRPDIHGAIDARGKAEGKKGQNVWPVDLLVKGDVYVADQFGIHDGGPTIGDNVGNAIFANSGNGIVYNGAIRDIAGLKEIGGFTSYYRSYHPSHHNQPRDLNTMLIGINKPTKIGQATVMAGDVVLGRDGAVSFIPAHLVEQVVVTSEVVRLRDMFGHERIREGKYTAGDIDTRWSDEIEKDFSQWLESHIDELPIAREQIQEILKNRTW